MSFLQTELGATKILFDHLQVHSPILMGLFSFEAEAEKSGLEIFSSELLYVSMFLAILNSVV